MKTLALAMLLAVMQAGPPVPRKIPDNPAQTTAPVKSKGATSQAPTGQADTKDQYDPRTDNLYRHYLFATVVGVIGGVVGIGILVWQTVLTRRSANAALLSAQAIVNTDRPWVVIFGIYDVRQGSSSFGAGNLGKTPAEIVGFYAEHRCVGNINELPSVPEYGTKHIPLVTLLVPGNKLGDHQIDLLDHDTFLEKVNSCKREPGEMFPTPPKLSVFYFRVVYRHPLSRIRTDIPDYETRMCFCFSPADPQAPNVCGPDKYNAYT